MNAPLFPQVENSDELLEYCQWRTGKKIVIDYNNGDAVETLAAYFSGYTGEFEEINSNKGILLMGNVGTGKTFIMNAMQENPFAPYRVVSVEQIANEYKKGGIAALDTYKSVLFNTMKNKYFGNEQIGLCIDDVGAETEAKHYGESINVVVDLLTERYKLRHNLTHITTNLTINQFREFYGLRVFDRMREMFNIVSFHQDAPSRR